MLRNENFLKSSRVGRNHNYNGSVSTANAEREVEMLRAPLTQRGGLVGQNEGQLRKSRSAIAANQSANRSTASSDIITQQEQYQKPPAQETPLEAFGKLRDTRFKFLQAQREKEGRDHALFLQRRLESGNNLSLVQLRDLRRSQEQQGASSIIANLTGGARSQNKDFSDFSFASADSRKKFILIDVIPSQVPNPNDPYLAWHFPNAHHKMMEYQMEELPSTIDNLRHLNAVEGVSSVFQQLKKDFTTRFLKSEKDRLDLKPVVAEPLYWRRAHIALLDRDRHERSVVLRQSYMNEQIPNLKRLRNFHEILWPKRVAKGMAAINDEDMRVLARSEIQLHLLKASERRLSILTDRRLKLQADDVERKIKVERVHAQRREIREAQRSVHAALGMGGGNGIAGVSTTASQQMAGSFGRSAAALNMVKQEEARAAAIEQRCFGCDRGSEEDQFHDASCCRCPTRTTNRSSAAAGAVGGLHEEQKGRSVDSTSKTGGVVDQQHAMPFILSGYQSPSSCPHLTTGIRAPPPSLASTSLRQRSLGSMEETGVAAARNSNTAAVSASVPRSAESKVANKKANKDKSAEKHIQFSPESIKADIDGGHNKYHGVVVDAAEAVAVTAPKDHQQQQQSSTKRSNNSASRSRNRRGSNE